MGQQPLDLASFIGALFAVFVAPPLAHVLGVYTAIVIGAVFGAGVALVRNRAMTRARAAGFVLLMAGVSIVTTVGVAELINHWMHLPSINPLLAPLALGIAAIGHSWPQVARQAWGVLRRVFERRVGGPDHGGHGGYTHAPVYPPMHPPRIGGRVRFKAAHPDDDEPDDAGTGTGDRHG